MIKYFGTVFLAICYATNILTKTVISTIAFILTIYLILPKASESVLQRTHINFHRVEAFDLNIQS